jgi:hypothetical protein
MSDRAEETSMPQGLLTQTLRACWSTMPEPSPHHEDAMSMSND